VKHTVEYALSRAEVWRTYWRAWAQPAGLWRFHVAIGILVAVAVSVLNRDAHYTWLIIGTNRNAMIVPRRAFADDSARKNFLEDARSWHAAAT